MTPKTHKYPRMTLGEILKANNITDWQGLMAYAQSMSDSDVFRNCLLLAVVVDNGGTLVLTDNVFREALVDTEGKSSLSMRLAPEENGIKLTFMPNGKESHERED